MASSAEALYEMKLTFRSLRSVGVIAGALGRAGEAGRKRRLADAQKDMVTWHNPDDVVRHMRRETKLIIEERKAVMGRIQEKVQGFSEEEQKLLRQRDAIEGVEVTESEMMDMLGETAVENSKESSGPGLASVEEQLLKAKEAALSLETEVKATSKPSGKAETEAAASPASDPLLKDIEKQLLLAKSVALSLETDVKAIAESAPAAAEASPAADPLLEGIEKQLLNAKEAALSLETEVKATSAPEVKAQAETKLVTSSKLESIEELLLEASGAASALEAEVKASSQQPAETEAVLEASSKLESIEDQLAGLQKEAQAIEAQLNPGSDKSQ